MLADLKDWMQAERRKLSRHSPVAKAMIETFELKHGPRSSAIDPRSGAELVAEAVAKPVGAWLPAGAHAEAVVLAGVDASAGVAFQGDPCPVLLRITGPAWTAAPSGSGDGAAMRVDVDGCTVSYNGLRWRGRVSPLHFRGCEAQARYSRQLDGRATPAAWKTRPTWPSTWVRVVRVVPALAGSEGPGGCAAVGGRGGGYA